jgi:hypothetical protein
MPEELRKCPFTGKMVPFERRPVADMINPRPLPPKVKESETERVDFELKRIRSKWSDISSAHRCGKTGDKLMKEYRKLSLEYWHITGNHPPKIDADL